MVDGDYGAGNLSLREAIAIALPGDTIAFDLAVFPDPTAGTITLALGELLVNKALTINGDDRVTLDGNGAARIFNLDDSHQLTR